MRKEEISAFINIPVTITLNDGTILRGVIPHEDNLVTFIPNIHLIEAKPLLEKGSDYSHLTQHIEIENIKHLENNIRF